MNNLVDNINKVAFVYLNETDGKIILKIVTNVTLFLFFTVEPFVYENESSIYVQIGNLDQEFQEADGDFVFGDGNAQITLPKGKQTTITIYTLC